MKNICFQRVFDFINKNVIYKEKSGTVIKVRLLTKNLKASSALFGNFGIGIVRLLWR